MQNANDANASAVEIIFEKSPASEDEPALVTNISLRNNGRPFDGNDWDRLRRIAEGNPDEQKVSFFPLSTSG